jgi:hypothetical protein
MKLRDKEIRDGSLAMLKIWRDMKYKKVDEEYNRKVEEYDRKISKQEEEVSQIIGKLKELVDEGEASIIQVKQLKKEIEIMENQVNKLMINKQIQISSLNNTNEFDLINNYVQLGSEKYFVKGRVFCGGDDLYALESEKPCSFYDGLCPQCRTTHVSLQSNRGFYVLCRTLHERLKTA